MGLFLLGIPLAIASGAMLSKNIKYTSMDLRIKDASPNLNKQYKQIESNIIDIIDYSGANCKIKRNGSKKKVINAKKGEYGGMERYLAEKGFYPQAIDYAKHLFDCMAKKETVRQNNQIENRINDFENKMKSNKTKDVIVRNKVLIYMPQFEVEKKIEELTNYFNSHNNEVYCNIIFNDINDFIKHEQVWHIKEPMNADASQYYQDVCKKLNMGW